MYCRWLLKRRAPVGQQKDGGSAENFAVQHEKGLEHLPTSMSYVYTHLCIFYVPYATSLVLRTYTCS